MKRFAASIGLVALGAASVQAAYSPGLDSMEASKPWSISASLRGFYDDNLNDAPNGYRVGTFGFEISPAATLNWALDQTLLSLGYVYSFSEYDHLPYNNTEKYDQTHSFNLALNHTFSERYRLNVTDSFVIGQDPDFLRAGNTFDTFFRASGNNIRNYGTINFDAQITRLLGIEVGYANALYDYADDTVSVDPNTGIVNSASNAGLLNRLEHTIHFDTRWQILPDTIGVVGYRFGEVDYTGNQAVYGDTSIPPSLWPLLANTPYAGLVPIYSSNRNNRSHTGYVGFEHIFLPNLMLAVRGGVDYSDYYNYFITSTSLTPYALMTLSYTYMKEGSVEIGFTYDRTASYRISESGNGNITQDAESATVWASIDQRIMPNLYGHIIGQFQNSMYNGGGIDNESDKFYLVGVNLSYRFNPHLSADVGYNFDLLDTNLGDGYDKNRVYMGVSARY